MRTTLLILFITLVNILNAQKLELEIVNIDTEKKGNIKIAIYDSKDNFLKEGKFIRRHAQWVTHTTHVVVFDSLPAGNYSVSLFHDENLDNKLNSNFLFIPKEGYGFSNNPKLYGPPKWDKTNFYFDGDDLKIQISIVY